MLWIPRILCREYVKYGQNRVYDDGDKSKEEFDDDCGEKVMKKKEKKYPC